MSFSKIFLASACALVLMSCSNNNTGSPEPAGTATLGDSSNAEQHVPLSFQVDKVASWKGGAKAAYSITHDDFCDYSLAEGGLDKHYKELNKRNLRAAFGVIVGSCEARPHYYDRMRQMVTEKHEIINHSFAHSVLTSENADLDKEINLSSEILRQNGFEINAYVFPRDTFNDALLQRLKNLGYIGARGGSQRGVNSAELDINDPLAPFRIRFDAFYEDPNTGQNTYSIYADQGDVLLAYLDDAIQQGGWAVRELHGVEDGSWGTVSLAKYTAHLDYVATKVQANEIWMDTFTNVNRYRSSRAYCGEALAQDGAVVFSLSTSADCTKYTTPLSVIITTNGMDDITATQNDVAIPSKRLEAGKYMLEIDPAAGPAYVNKSL